MMLLGKIPNRSSEPFSYVTFSTAAREKASSTVRNWNSSSTSSSKEISVDRTERLPATRTPCGNASSAYSQNFAKRREHHLRPNRMMKLHDVTAGLRSPRRKIFLQE